MPESGKRRFACQEISKYDSPAVAPEISRPAMRDGIAIASKSLAVLSQIFRVDEQDPGVRSGLPCQRIELLRRGHIIRLPDDTSREPDETLTLKRLQELAHRRCRDRQVLAREVHRGFDRFRIRRVQLTKKIVRMARGNTVRCQACGWKISEIEGQQDRGTSFNRGGQDMAVASIRQHQVGGPVLVTAHIGFWENAAHDFEGPRQAFTRGASISDQVANPLLVDFSRPTQVNEALDTELDEQISEMEGIEEIGVDEDDRRCGRARIRGHAP